MYIQCKYSQRMYMRAIDESCLSTVLLKDYHSVSTFACVLSVPSYFKVSPSKCKLVFGFQLLCLNGPRISSSVMMIIIPFNALHLLSLNTKSVPYVY